MTLGIGLGCIFIIFMKIFETQMVMIFSTSDDIYHFTHINYNLFLLMFSLDWLVTMLNGPIRGIGKQGLASFNSLIAYYILELPVSYYLTFYYG